MHDKTYENIDLSTLKFLYVWYKDFIIPVFIIFVSLLLFVKIIIPQLWDLLKVYEEQKAAIQTLSIMQNKLNFLKSISDSTLDSQLTIVSRALPTDKDFAGVLYALSDASSKAGVSLADFKFTVGSLSQIENEGKLLTFDLDITLTGNPKVVTDFISRLRKTLPLSEVTKISIQENLSTLAVHFYYEPLTNLKYNDSVPIRPVSAIGLSLIKELSSFSIPQASIIPETPSILIATPTPALVPLLTTTSSARTNPFFDISP